MSTATRRYEPRKTPVQPRAAETRDRILAAAAHVFGEHGYSAGTTNRIAEAAGVSIGSLYQYFPNKDAILVALVRNHVEAGFVAVTGALDELQPGDAIEARLGWFVDLVIAQHQGDPRLHQVLFEEAPRPADLVAELHAEEERLIGVVAALLRADPEVTVADHELAARMLVVGIESYVHRFVAVGDDPKVDLGAFRDELVAMLSAYLTG
jgi:AcrR family transcriptional regulator